MNPVSRSSVFFLNRSSAFFLFGSSTQFHPFERGLEHPQGIGRVLSHLSLDESTGVFLFGRGEIKLPLPRFELTILNSVTFGAIFPLFAFNLATSPFPKGIQIKGWTLSQRGKSNPRTPTP